MKTQMSADPVGAAAQIAAVMADIFNPHTFLMLLNQSKQLLATLSTFMATVCVKYYFQRLGVGSSFRLNISFISFERLYPAAKIKYFLLTKFKMKNPPELVLKI